MPIKSIPCVCVQCDGCGIEYHDIYTTPIEKTENLKLNGWTGTYKKLFCPRCSQHMVKENKDG